MVTAADVTHALSYLNDDTKNSKSPSDIALMVNLIDRIIRTHQTNIDIPSNLYSIADKILSFSSIEEAQQMNRSLVK